MAALNKVNAESTSIVKDINADVVPCSAVSPPLPPIPIPPAASTSVIADTGCTGHFLMLHGPYTNPTPVNPGIQVTLPSGQIIASTHVAQLNIPHLPPSAQICHVFPDLAAGSLLSVGLLTDHGCQALFDHERVTIFRGPQVVLKGRRDPNTRLWTIDMTAPPADTPVYMPTALTASSCSNTFAHTALATMDTVAKRVAFLHAAMFSPAISTWCAAIDAGRFTTWPSLTSAQVRRHAPFSVPMIKGHLDQARANQRSTKPGPPPGFKSFPLPDEEGDLDANPAPGDAPLARSHFIYADCQDVTGQIFTDPTGRFITPSSSGNAYILMVYDYDSNYIHAEPMRSRSGPDILDAYQRAVALLTKRGLRPQLQRLDNEASLALQEYMAEQQIDFQLAPPHVHRRNAAERAIRTFKNHFIAGLCSTDKDFPLHLWDRLLPQALLTLNLLRGSRINPQLSAQAQVHGAFDYNRTPLAPPGIRVLVHEKPATRGTWAPHAVDGWYLGPAMHHYRCYRVWIWETCAERISDTLAWFPTKVSMPSASSTDEALAAAKDLVQALLHPTTAGPVNPLSDSQRHALRELATIFADVNTPPTTNPAATPAEVPRVVPPTVEPLNAPLPRVQEEAGAITYEAQTGNMGKRRRAKKRAKKVAPTTSPTTTPTAEPPPAGPAKPPTSTSQPDTSQWSPAPSAFNDSATNPHRTRARQPTVPQALQASLPTPQANCCDRPTELPPHAFWHAANSVLDPVTGASLTYTQLCLGPEGEEWLRSTANEIGRLAQGVQPHMPEGTNTMFFIPHTSLPPGRQATYLRVVAEEKPLKAEKKRVRFTVGGNRIDYPGNVSTPTADLTTAKILINSVISTPGARFATADISNFYLNNPMEHNLRRTPSHEKG
jgi:hypothetical protein